MNFKTTLWAILVFSMLIVAAGVIVDERAEAYSSTASSDLGGDFNKINDLSGTAELQKGRINPQSGEASSDYEAETFRGGYGIITSIFAPLRVVFGDGGMIDAVTERFGIPDYIRITLVTMFMFAITFGIIAIVFRLGWVSM